MEESIGDYSGKTEDCTGDGHTDIKSGSGAKARKGNNQDIVRKIKSIIHQILFLYPVNTLDSRHLLKVFGIVGDNLPANFKNCAFRSSAAVVLTALDRKTSLCTNYCGFSLSNWTVSVNRFTISPKRGLSLRTINVA